MVNATAKNLRSKFSIPPLLPNEEPEAIGNLLANQFKQGLHVAVGDNQNKGLMPWESSAKRWGEGQQDIDIKTTPIAEQAAYGAGRVAGSVANDSLRSWWWAYNHPLAIAKTIGTKIPEAAGMVDENGKVPLLPTVLAGAGIAAAVDAFSGNTDFTNLAEQGRPQGYSALFPSPEDPTKSTQPLLELPVGYVLGKRGKMLPWEQFHEERPDVSPEDFARYKEYQKQGHAELLGLESANPYLTSAIGAGVGTAIAKAKQKSLGKGAAIGAVAGLAVPAVSNFVSSMGILKGTMNNLDNQPEVQMLGYPITASGAVLTGGLGLGMYALAKRAANQRKQEFSSLMNEARVAGNNL